MWMRAMAGSRYIAISVGAAGLLTFAKTALAPALIPLWAISGSGVTTDFSLRHRLEAMQKDGEGANGGSRSI